MLAVPLLGAGSYTALGAGSYTATGSTTAVAAPAKNITCTDQQLVGITVTGNLTVPPGAWCDLVRVTVQGNLVADHATGFRILNSVVSGNLEVDYTTAAADPFSPGVNAVGGTKIGGNLIVDYSSAGAPWQIGGPAPWNIGGIDPNTIGKSVQFQGNAAAGNVVSDNVVQGALLCQGPTSVGGARNLVSGANIKGCAGTHTIVYAAPDGAGSVCTQAQPCSVPGAQLRVRNLLAAGVGEDVVVELADGTYRLSAPLEFGPEDSGSNGHQVIWEAAPGARPVLSGALKVTGWSLVDPAKNIWEAPVPASLNTRQIYVNGAEAPIASTTPAEQGITGWAANGTVGQTTTPATWGPDLLAQIGAANLARVEFVYTGGNGPWTQPRCRIASLGTGGQLVMQQPCWMNTTARPTFSQASGGLPNMSTSTAPTRIENAYPFLHAGQWYLNQDTHVLDYIPLPGQDMAKVDVEAPVVDGYLVHGVGTLDNPVQNITFAGLQFSYATWTAPSAPTGWAEVQSNLRLTGADPTNPQFVCTFGTPPGTCPFGNLDKDLANIQFSYAHNVNFEGNTFAHLGGAGLSFDYGSQYNTIEGNVFTDIAGVGIILGDTLDPHPSDVGMDNREINAYNTIDNNVIHGVGVDYPSATGIEIFFTQHTTAVHNNLYDLPYTAITPGVVQGHVDNSSHPENTTNINSDNTISDNLFHNFMTVLSDGGAMYIEGHQAMTKYLNPDGTVNNAETLAHGMLAEGNVAYGGPHNNYVWYDDAGSEWINWTGNVEWQAAGSGEGGCEPTGHIWFTGNYSSQRTDYYTACSPGPLAGTTFASGNTVLPASPGAADLPLDILANAGLVGRFQLLETTAAPSINYVHSSVSGIAPAPTEVFVAGNGFAEDTQVTFAGSPATDVNVLNPWFLVATAPAGANFSQFTVTTQKGSVLQGSVLPNVIFGKPAVQKDTWGAPGYDASKAVDGDLENLSATNGSEVQPWWQVDAGASFLIDTIAIYDRVDCCENRLANYYVFVSDTPFVSTDLNTTLAQPGVWSSLQTAQAGRPTTIDVGQTGRYIRVQLAGINELDIAEIEAFSNGIPLLTEP